MGTQTFGVLVQNLAVSLHYIYITLSLKNVNPNDESWLAKGLHWVKSQSSSLIFQN